jgi:hypothetical protein
VTDDTIAKTHDELTELWFLLLYDPEYRYLKQSLLLYEYDNLDKIIPALGEAQCEHLKFMIEIEMIVNAIQYCNMLGATAICTKTNRLDELGHMLANMADYEIQTFYNGVCDASLDEIKGYMGYDKLSTKDYSDKRYLESCERFKGLVCILSKLYNTYIYFYLSYKHGLRIIPSHDIDGNTIIAAPLDKKTGTPHEVRMLRCSPISIQNDTIEIVDTVHHIYTKLYIPLLRRKFLELIGVLPDEYAKLGASKVMESNDPVKTGYNINVKTPITHPYWINDGTEPKPFL